MNIRTLFVAVALIVAQLITLIGAQNVPTVEAISEDITGENFEGAVTKIKGRDDLQSTMNSVIFKLNSNNNNEGVFKLLLQFLDYNADNKEISLATYRAIYKNIDRNNPKDRVRKLRLINSYLNSYFHFTPQLLPPKGTIEFKDELHNSVSNIVREDLKDALKTNNNDALSTICEDVYEYYPTLFKQVFKTVLNEVFNETNVENVIKFFVNHKHAAQSIYALSAVFNELKKGNLNQEFLVDLAFGLKEAAAAKEVAGDDGIGARLEVTNVKDNLPKSVRNLAFAERVCIKNTDLKEYLYAASDGFNYNTERRNLYTWIPGDKISQGVWFIVRNGDAYLIKNQEHADEYVYASYGTAKGFWNFVRYVFTWIPKGTGNNDLEFNWKFEPTGDDVYIKNNYALEYLSATSEKDDKRRYVYTWFDNTKHANSKWTIEDCTWVH